MHTKMRDFIDLLLKNMFGRKTHSGTAHRGASPASVRPGTMPSKEQISRQLL
jgi:hypothetical protein